MTLSIRRPSINMRWMINTVLLIATFGLTSITRAEGDAPPASGAEVDAPHHVIGMSYNDYVTGSIVGTLFGFGSGHALQGRYADNGWKFTATEIAAVGIIAASLAPCKSDFFSSHALTLNQRLDKCQKTGLVVGNLLGAATHLYEVFDLWLTPNPALHHHFFGGTNTDANTWRLALSPPLGNTAGSLNLTFDF